MFRQVAYYDLTESSEDYDEVGTFSSDDSDSDTVSNMRKRRKYILSETCTCKNLQLPLWCPHALQNLSRKELIYLVIGSAVILFLIALVALIVSVIIVATYSTSETENAYTYVQDYNISSNGFSGDSIRLQTSIIPETYDISLTLNMGDFQVAGSVSIACTVTESVQFIPLHARDMTITGHRVLRDGKEIEHNEVIFEKNDFYIFNLTNVMEPGSIHLLMDFNYTLREDLTGFYRSSFIDENGNRHYLGTTQFEPTNARKAFPCFDEPSLKANFTIHMTHQSWYWTSSNMPPTHRTEEDSHGFVTTHFETSVKMSTYLVAFVVSEFECVNETIVSTSGKPLLIRVCSNPTVMKFIHYALEIAKNVILFYEQEFGIPYPLPKLDLFAIPDFLAGAMENWGLTTYRETALLYDKATDPAKSKQWVASTIAHELAHQWFGDLVTMAWWDGIWLNEGFATFMEYLGTNNIEPSFNVFEQFASITALKSDSLKNSHPILQEVRNFYKIKFDSIIYDKGASILRMLRDYIGVDAFRSGITLYLDQHKYGNAETYELWEALQTVAPAAGATLTEIMDTWTRQMGYPVFTVNQTANTLTQTRFLTVKPDDPASIPSSPYGYLWKAPFNYLHFSNENSEATISDLLLVAAKSTHVKWQTDGWIKANIGQTGFYRVNYEVSNWWAIIEYLKTVDLESSVLSTVDRAGLLDDAFALSQAGLLDTRIALNLSEYLLNEREYLPWNVALSHFYKLDTLLHLTPLYGQYKEFVGSLLRPVVSFLPTTSKNLTHLDIYLRSEVLEAAAHFGSNGVIENATELFRQWRMENISVDPNLKSVVYGIGIANGGEVEWDFVWEKYSSSNDPHEKRLYLKSLAQSRELWILNRYLNYSISKLQGQDTLGTIIFISQNIYGQCLAWNFVLSNWNHLHEILALYIPLTNLGSEFICSITEGFTTEYELQQVIDMYHDTGTETTAFLQAIEIIRGNIEWLDDILSGDLELRH